MSLIVHILKAVLVVFSCNLARVQHKAANSIMVSYWCIVVLYRLFNLLSGLIK